MPYKIEKRGDQWCVIRRDTGENKGCSHTKEEAQAHMNAMLAGEHDKGAAQMSEADLNKLKEIVIFDQQQVNYTPLSPMTGQACANCLFYRATGYDGIEYPHCHLVACWPDPIEPTGYCDRWEGKPEPQPQTVEPIPVVIVEPPMDMDDSGEMEMSLSIPKTLVQRVKDFVSGLVGTAQPPVFQVFKTASGKKAWLARHTGKFVDRENEILAERAHEEYVARVQKGIVPPPELWMWHVKGTKHGQAVAVWKSGGFVCAAGYFDDTPAGNKAFNYYQQHSGSIKLSHMFHYPKTSKVDGVYFDYNTIEITTLPNGAEAFPYTSFQEIQTMAIPAEARTMIAEALGEEVLRSAEALDAQAGKDTKTLEDQGVAWKGYDQYNGSTFSSLDQKWQDLQERLAATEQKLLVFDTMQTGLQHLQEQIKTLTEQIETTQNADANLLETVNTLQGKIAELTDLKPPASESGDTLLNKREKSLIEAALSQAQADNQTSLIEKLLGVQAPSIGS